MESTYRRVNITILEEQYDLLAELGLNFSGLVRDLVGDYLSESVISLPVTEETKRLYDQVVANTGSSDQEIEVHLRTALADVLEQKIVDMRSLHQKLLK